MKSFDENWQFSYGDNWVDVTLPHDASISFSADNCGGFRPDGWSSEDGASGYLPYGKCAYRKNFSVKHGEDELVFLVFVEVEESQLVLMFQLVLFLQLVLVFQLVLKLLRAASLQQDAFDLE